MFVAPILSILFALVHSQADYGANFGGFQLPEVLDNRFRSAGGYNYQVPNIPFDETIPPSLNPQNNNTIPPFQDDLPQPTYLPPSQETEPPVYDPVPPPNTYLPQHKTAKFLQDATITILKMSCLTSKTSTFFRAQIQPKFSSLPPVIEDSIGVKEGCVTSVGGNIYTLNFENDSIVNCGVRRCSSRDLCVKLRIPTVKGLKLPEDTTVVLQCKPQDSVASQVRSLRFNPRIVQGRALSTVASGGSQRKFETEVFLYRRAQEGSGEFTQVVSPGSSVQLGEDLMLRAAVRDGDGWAFSRLGAVVMQRTATGTKNNPQGTGENFLTLLDENGCRSQGMKAICPEEPHRINPLVTTFLFRAFMFQESIPGDEMILSVRMHGCLQYEDCPQVTFCEENVKGNMIRSKRETENGTRRPEDHTADWKSYLEFRVVPSQDMKHIEGNNFDKDGGPLATPFMVTCITTSVILLLVLTVIFMKRHLRHA